ncbi:IS110 family transposase [Streptomyces dysideae]|uniref:IS110 family transposase n=1 Tax=Streptomyces dysideae TaxID=909626 RepID=UPI000B1DE69A|nr:IS110 family transposase [Streptomyces dysideae]
MILAEIGADISRFPSAGHLPSWAGLCPGSYESAGKSLSGKSRPGDPWLQGVLAQAAISACRTKDTYLAARYRRLVGRRGRRRALLPCGTRSSSPSGTCSPAIWSTPTSAAITGSSKLSGARTPGADW